MGTDRVLGRQAGWLPRRRWPVSRASIGSVAGGLRRALARHRVGTAPARELSVANSRPLTAFTTARADQRDAPYASAARNRTVTVVIIPG
ncbi:hypothetical protein [Streptomyces sp. NPDC096013]|uniref:hypothetical protein n=1 Tax=Streptomyces sp. NPDC096013 TaxID=3366069 RepID=UPI003815F2B1